MKNKNFVYIYGLEDPRTNAIMYVGATKDPIGRYKQHITLRKVCSEKEKWIQELIEVMILPRLVILNVVSHENASDEENKWINIFSTTVTNAKTSFRGEFLKRDHTNRIKRSIDIDRFIQEYCDANKQVPSIKDITENVRCSKSTASKHRNDYLSANAGFVQNDRSHKANIISFMDAVWATENRVATWKEVIEHTGAGKATVSDVRKEWIAGHGINMVASEEIEPTPNGHEHADWELVRSN